LIEYRHNFICVVHTTLSIYHSNNANASLFPVGGCGQAFSALIVSPHFLKKTTLARHRLVNSALKAEIAAIHAWTPKCYTPEEWEKQGGSAVAPGKDTTGEVVSGTTA
jgi:stress-induced morphogen